jgi:putative ABC transport system permease protein
MFAFNAMLVTAHLRRRLVESLRRRGATRTMTVQVLLFDALVLGVLGTLIGLALGEALSILVFRAEPGYLAFAFAVGEQRIVAWQSVALAAGAGLLAACVGVLAPLHDVLVQRLRSAPSPDPGWKPSSRAPSLREPSQMEHSPGEPNPGEPSPSKPSLRSAPSRCTRVRAGSHARRGQRGTRAALRLAPGAGCLAITTAILLVRPQSAILGSITLVAALLLLLPFAFDAILACFEALQRPLYAASTRIAIVELHARHNRMRSLAIAATGAVAVFGSVAIEGARSNLQRGLDASAREIDSNASVWVSPQSEANAFTTIPFTGTAARTLARLPGVSAVEVYRGGFLDWGDRRVWVLAPPRAAARPIPARQLVQGQLGPATAAIRGSGWAVLSQALAASHHLRIGERFTLPSPHPAILRVAALSTNLAWPPGAIVLSAGDYVHAWGSADPSAYQIQIAPGAAPTMVRGEIQRALGAQTGLVAETASQRVRGNYTTTRQALSRLAQIGTLVLIAAVLAMAGAMGSMIWQRRPQLAYIKRQGYKRGVLWRALLCESALLLGAGCSLGAGFGIYGQVLLSHALASVTGFPIVFSTRGLAAFWSFALVSAAAVAILALPGYLAVRVHPTTVSTT